MERVIDTAGVSFKLPFIQTADTLPRKILLYDLAASDVITMDKKTMLSDSYVLWKITDPLLFAQTLNSSIVNAEGRIDTVVYNSVKNVISSMSQNEVISGRDGELSQAIMTNVGDSMAEAYRDPQKAEFYSYARSLEAARVSLKGDGNTLILPADSPIARIFMGQ